MRQPASATRDAGARSPSGARPRSPCALPPARAPAPSPLRPRRPGLFAAARAVAFALLLAPHGAAAKEGRLDLEAIRSRDVLVRSRALESLLEGGREAIQEVSAALEAGGPTWGREDRGAWLELEGVFRQIVDPFAAELEKERRVLEADQRELQDLQDRREAARLREELGPRLEAARREDPELEAKLTLLVELEGLEALEAAAQAGRSGPLTEPLRARLEDCRERQRLLVAAQPDLLKRLEPLLRLARIEARGVSLRPLTDLESIRIGDLEERIASRKPRTEKLEAEALATGLPLFDVALGSNESGKTRWSPLWVGLLEKRLAASQESIFVAEEAFDTLRYSRGILWSLESERRGPSAAEAEASLQRHLEATLRDLESAAMVVRERAEEELYRMGAPGIEALERGLRELVAAGKPTSQLDFLLGLLRWRIRPRLYTRTGLDFSGYSTYSYIEKRRKIFDYARVAQEAAIPTLRAIVTRDELETSLALKLAAAKALSGLRDLTGYNELLRLHPELTLKRPEVSREILLIQGLERIRDKDYLGAAEEFRKILEELPFDFQANYHIAFAYLLLKNYAKAIHHFEIARRIDPQDQLTLYNLACAYALSGAREREALDALEAAVAAGFADRDHIEKDPDLESLRSIPRYQEILRSIGAPSDR